MPQVVARRVVSQNRLAQPFQSCRECSCPAFSRNATPSRVKSEAPGYQVTRLPGDNSYREYRVGAFRTGSFKRSWFCSVHHGLIPEAMALSRLTALCCIPTLLFRVLRFCPCSGQGLAGYSLQISCGQVPAKNSQSSVSTNDNRTSGPRLPFPFPMSWCVAQRHAGACRRFGSTGGVREVEMFRTCGGLARDAANQLKKFRYWRLDATFEQALIRKAGDLYREDNHESDGFGR